MNLENLSVVFDTNIFISSVVFGGKPGEVYMMALNGRWDYAIRPLGQQEATGYDGKILVPFPVESALSGVKKPLLPTQQLCYRRIFKLPQKWQHERLLLHFGAVDWQAKISGKRAAGR